jgi:menaquinone-9 beta-reductase
VSARWDAIVVGASFSGLAAARGLVGAGQVLVIDRQPLGAGQTSACAAPLPLLEWFGAEESVEQVHHVAVFHLPDGSTREMPFPYPFATFDYLKICHLLMPKTGVTFLQAAAQGMPGAETVATNRGEHTAPVIFDASGWRAVLAPEARRDARSVGLETSLSGTRDGLHFWVHHRAMRNGYAWDFPAGGSRRIGVITYGSSGRLRSRLEQFVDGQLASSTLHGGSLPARLRDPVAGRVFLVGDAAGLCLPVTGEGIRPALVLGYLAGRLGGQVLSRELTLEAAHSSYRKLVGRYRRGYAALTALQGVLGKLPRFSIKTLYWLTASRPLVDILMPAYWSVASMDLLEEAERAGTPRGRPGKTGEKEVVF